jgi:hypothetical protein
MLVSEFAETPKLLTGEFLSIDGLATRTITLGEITSLKHEVFDHTVKLGSFVSNLPAAWLLKTYCEFTEILAGLRNDIVVELESDALRWVRANFDIELPFPV